MQTNILSSFLLSSSHWASRPRPWCSRGSVLPSVSGAKSIPLCGGTARCTSVAGDGHGSLPVARCDTAVNIGVRTLVRTLGLSSVGRPSRSGIAGSGANSVFKATKAFAAAAAPLLTPKSFCLFVCLFEAWWQGNHQHWAQVSGTGGHSVHRRERKHHLCGDRLDQTPAGRVPLRK